jgi:hypothetical protein
VQKDLVMAQLTRRELLFRAVPLGVAGIALARGARAGSCVEPESESLRTSLIYVATAPDPTSSCAHCAFFTADPAGDACGMCKILGGAVDSTGHCDSFSPPT